MGCMRAFSTHKPMHEPAGRDTATASLPALASMDGPSAGQMAAWSMPPSRTVVHPPRPTLEPAQRPCSGGPSPCMSPPHTLRSGPTCRIGTRSREVEHRRHRRRGASLPALASKGGQTCVCLAHSPPGRHCTLHTPHQAGIAVGGPANARARHTRYAAGPRAASAHTAARWSTADTAAAAPRCQHWQARVVRPAFALHTSHQAGIAPCTLPTGQALQWGPSPCMSPAHTLCSGPTCRIGTRSRGGAPQTPPPPRLAASTGKQGGQTCVCLARSPPGRHCTLHTPHQAGIAVGAQPMHEPATHATQRARGPHWHSPDLPLNRPAGLP